VHAFVTMFSRMKQGMGGSTSTLSEKLDSTVRVKQKKEVKYKPHVLHEVCKEETRLLREWIEKHGGEFRKVCVGKSLTGERGLFLTEDAKEGETVLSVPKECLIKADLFEQHPEMKAMCTRKIFLQNRNFESIISPLALYLVLESRKQESFFSPYIDTLPEDFIIPGFQDIDYRVHNDEMLQSLAELRAKLENFRQHCIENDIQISPREWLRVCSAVQSRSFFHKKRSAEAFNLLKKAVNLNYDPFFTMLFPVGDMANHSDVPSIKVNAQEGTMTALRDLESKEEIVFDYMPDKTDEDYFYLYYGLPRIRKGWTKVDVSFD